MDDEPRPDDQQPPDAEGGEPGREEVAGQRGDQPGYDLDEGEAYKQAAAGSGDEDAAEEGGTG